MSQQTTTSTEKFDVKGGHLVAKVKELVHEGNVRRIIIKDSDGRTAMEVPVTLGVVGFLVAPTDGRDRRARRTGRGLLDRSRARHSRFDRRRASIRRPTRDGPGTRHRMTAVDGKRGEDHGAL